MEIEEGYLTTTQDPIMTFTLDCSVCLQTYNTQDRRPVVGICGHSLCHSCLMRILETDQVYRKCPRCKMEFAYQEGRVNYQMAELIEGVQVALSEKESELSNERSRSETALSSLEHVNKQLAEAERRETELRKRVESLAKQSRKLQAEKQALVAEQKKHPQCSECGFRVAETRTRVCLPCLRAEGALTMTDDKITIKDMNLTEKHLLCGSCCLEGPHQTHKTHTFLPIKLAQSATVQFSSLNTLLENSVQSDSWMQAFDVAAKAPNNIFAELDNLKETSKRAKSWNDFEVVCKSTKEVVYELEAENQSMRQKLAEYCGRVQQLHQRLTDVGASSSTERSVVASEEKIRLSSEHIVPCSSDESLAGSKTTVTDDKTTIDTAASNASGVVSGPLFGRSQLH